MPSFVTSPLSSHNVFALLARETRARVAVDPLGTVLDLFLRVLVVASVAIALTALWLGPQRIFYTAGAHALIDGFLLWRLRRGAFPGAALLVALSLWAAVSYASFLGQGTHDVGMVVLGILMMVAALLETRWQLCLITTLTLAVLWVMGLGEITGHYKHPASHLTTWQDLITLSIIFAATAVLMRVMIGGLAESWAVADTSERNYKEVFNATHEAIVILDCVDGSVLDANDAAFAILAQGQRDRSALVGRTVAEAMGVSVAEVTQWLAACEHGETVSQERLLAIGKAKPFWCELSLRAGIIDGKRRLLAIVRDVDARHRLQDELRQADKLRALGHLAGGVAHDFNNQLTGILANAELIKLEVEAHQAVTMSFIESIIKCALRSADLTRQLLAFARKARPRREEVDVGVLVREVAEMLKRGLHPGIVVEVDAPQQPLLTGGDPSLLHNALLNLGINAQEAMPMGGRLTFEARPVVLSDAQAKLLDISPGFYAYVAVHDTGSGMDEATRSQIFDPFFTTKDTGTGMGLAAAYGTIRSHGGRLTVRTERGVGSTFELYLPVALPLTLTKSQSNLQAVTPMGTKLRVMVVDDEPDVARTTSDMLSAAGHLAEAYNNPLMALEVFLGSPTAFDVVVIDRVMRELSGDQLLERLRLLRPDLPAVIVSGYSEVERTELTPTKLTAFLPKPFGPYDLSAALLCLLKGQKPEGGSLVAGTPHVFPAPGTALGSSYGKKRDHD